MELENRSKIILERKSLPIFSVRKKLLKKLLSSRSIIVIGETACGKTTQIPQFLYQAGSMKKLMIGITQPRRVAAITIAERVAVERNTMVGKLVGYSVRFDDKTTSETIIKYMTDGILLRESIMDPLLQRYSIIILDEAHERTLHTDVLFGIVKSAQAMREERKMANLQIIIMSATMNVEHFSHYFNNAPVYYIEGRQFPVQVKYTIKPQEDYVFAALVTVFQIHQNEAEGDILVFCTGQEEIESMVRAVKETSLQLPSHCLQIYPYPLYAALPSMKQIKVFQPASEGCRKVIFSTNIAETSITIPGVKYVIDTGMVKDKTFIAQCTIDLLKVHRISKAQAWQRCGRAGRTSGGSCYRLYTKEEYDEMIDHSIPEIQRCDLRNVVLQLLAIGINNISTFDFLDKPSEEAICNAIDQLELLAAIEDPNEPKLTEIGRQMTVFPVDPRFSKIIIAAKELKCTDEALTIVSMLCVESVFHIPSAKKDAAIEIIRKFHANEGDHIMLLNIYRAYKHVKGNKQWCNENMINKRNMKLVVAIRKQLYRLCEKVGIPYSSCGKETNVVVRCISRGLFLNAAALTRDRNYVTLRTRQKVEIHPTSCLFNLKPSFVVYTEVISTSKCYMQNISSVRPAELVDASPKLFKHKRFLENY